MNLVPVSKTVIPIAAVTTTAGTALTGIIDTLGYDTLALCVTQGTQSATTKPTALKLAEGDTTTAFTDITKFVGGGTGGFTIPESYTSTTSGQWNVKFNVDLRGRKRYLQVSHTTGTVTYAATVGLLMRGENAPTTAVDAGCAALVEG
jgi:hypothetical protein